MLDKSILQNLDQIKKSILVFDIECSSHYPDGREVNISSDFENYKKFAKVKWFGAYSYLHDKEYFLVANNNNAQEIMKLLQEHNTLCGFNSEEFDFPILVNNGYVDIEKKYLHIDLMQIMGTSTFKNRSGYAYKNRGQLMDFKFKNNSLRCMAETMKLEYLKGEIDYKLFHKSTWTIEEEKEIIAYLRNDVLANKVMFEKLWEYWLPFASLLDVKDIYNLSWIRSSIASLTYKAACKVLNTDPTYGEGLENEAEQMGGNVYLPKYEELKGVWYVDVGSLYPHMFAMANLPAEVNIDTVFHDVGVLEECELDLSQSKKYWHGNEIFQVRGYYKKDKWHPLSEYIASKLKERIALKETDKNNPMVYTLKIFLNGLYGIFRSPIFEKIHTPNCGWDCCWLGQQVQALIKEMLEQFGFEVVMGDTDSCFFIAKEGTDNTREYVQDCLNQISEVIKDNFPFPVDTFKIGIEHYLDYLMVPFEEQPIVGEDGKNLKNGNRLILERKGKKKNYVMVYKDKDEVVVDLVGLPIKKDNATALGMRIYEEVLKPEIIKNMRAKFPASYIQKVLNDYLKKPEIMDLISQEYKVKSAQSYKNNAIQKQISTSYFGGQEGVIKLIKNSKVGKVGLGTKYCTIQEAIDAKLTAEELDLEKVNQELSPFVEFEEVSMLEKVELPPQVKVGDLVVSEKESKIIKKLETDYILSQNKTVIITTPKKEDILVMKKSRGRPKGSKNKKVINDFNEVEEIQ